MLILARRLVRVPTTSTIPGTRQNYHVFLRMSLLYMGEYNIRDCHLLRLWTVQQNYVVELCGLEVCFAREKMQEKIQEVQNTLNY